LATGHAASKVVPVACLKAPTIDEIAHTISDVSGRQVRTEFVSEEEFQERRGRDTVVASQEWMGGWMLIWTRLGSMAWKWGR